MLNESRLGKLSDKSRETLKKLEKEPNWPKDGIEPVKLMAKIDLNGVFGEKGQVYVALSRACSLKYLWVTGFTDDKLTCDKKVKKFYQELIKI